MGRNIQALFNSLLTEGRITRPGYLSIVTGDADAICSPNLADRIAKQLQVDNLELLPGEGHMIRPELVAAIVDEFLDGK